jgi:hypothetical protein
MPKSAPFLCFHLAVAAAALALPAGAFCQTSTPGPKPDKPAPVYAVGLPLAGDSPGNLAIRIYDKDGGPIPKDPVPFIPTDLWQVAVYLKSGDRLVPAGDRLPAGDHAPASPFVNVKSVTPAKAYERTGQLILRTSGAFDASNFAQYTIEVSFLGGKELVTGSAAAASKPASSKSGCQPLTDVLATAGYYVNYCLSGIWVPQVGSHPLYSTNSNFAFAHGVGERARSGMFGITAQESADSSVVLDPNAFAASVFYRAFLPIRQETIDRIPGLVSVIFNWNLATVEFDRKKKNTNLGTNVNLITAPELAFNFALPANFGGELDTGIETGHNFKNNMNPDGFGTVFRGLLGAQLARVYTAPKSMRPVKTVKFSSRYQARILADNEVITRSVHGKLVPYAGRQTRNWVSTELDFMFTDNIGITLKHDYGELPPGFIVIENRATVGFTIQSSPSK